MDLEKDADMPIQFPTCIGNIKLDDSGQQAILPRINNTRPFQKHENPQKAIYSNQIFRLMQEKKCKTYMRKNESLLIQRVNHNRKQNQFKNVTMLTKPRNHEIFTRISPKINQNLQQKRKFQSELPRLRPSTVIPQLQTSRVLNDYRFISHVGKGCFSVVSAAVNKNNNQKFAIKTYNRVDQMNEAKLKNIQNEVQNLFTLQHDNIISLKHAVKDGLKIQLIMENGGQQSLSGLLRKTTAFQQNKAKKYFRQMAQALAHCHNQNICHRDIKLENILVDDKDNVKLIDFGFSLKCNNKARLVSFCGTPPYMSPELSAKSPYNGQSSDVWALGVALYLMTTGKFPFKANNQKQLYRLIQQGKYKNDAFSIELKQLLDSMLKVDEKSRISAQQIMSSNWLKSA